MVYMVAVTCAGVCTYQDEYCYIYIYTILYAHVTNKYPIFLQISSSTNTFQGILVTDGESSYAIFLYECGGMEWGGGVIGWQATPSDYESHHLSQNSDNDEIGCLYSTTTSTPWVSSWYTSL